MSAPPTPFRFTGPFRQSHLQDYCTCPRLFYYAHVKQLEPEYHSASALIGQAVHATVRDLHALSLWTEPAIRDRVQHHVHGLKEEIAKANGHLRWKSDPAATIEEAGDYLSIYAAKPHNQAAEILWAEEEWSCTIGDYPFTGRIDQVRRQDGKLILVDFKTSSYRPHELYLRRAYQLSIYAYAVREHFGRPPDEIWHYQLKDHLPYRRSGSWGKAGTERGPAIYVTHRTDADLTYLEQDISRICAAIRFGHHYRRPANLGACNGFCPYTQTCLGELEAPDLHPETIHLLEEVI